MTDAKPLFIDTNTLVYANVQESPFHASALTTLQTAYERGRVLWISRQVLREYLVTMTRPQAFATLDKATVLEQAEQFSQQFQVADETAAVTQQLLNLIQQHALGGKQVHDANIVATMQAYNIPCLLTHNTADFKRFNTLIDIEGINT